MFKRIFLFLLVVALVTVSVTPVTADGPKTGMILPGVVAADHSWGGEGQRAVQNPLGFVDYLVLGFQGAMIALR
jgi:hypothetical protein